VETINLYIKNKAKYVNVKKKKIQEFRVEGVSVVKLLPGMTEALGLILST
jgi:hypothetical protein